MQEAYKSLEEYVEEAAVRLDARLAETERAMRGVFAHRALVRYDAYNELSGHQSMSIALLDAERSGIVLSCIHHRDQARVYGKQVHDGRGEIELSPEEAEAVRLALSGAPADGPGSGAIGGEARSAVAAEHAPGGERGGGRANGSGDGAGDAA
jgi:hypothetical protein